VLGWPGDNFEYIWKMWWTARALGQGTSPFFNPDMYVPFGFDLAHGELTPANTFLFLPVTATLGPIWAYNVALISSFVLSGLGAYLLAARLTGDRDAALLAGAAFAFCSYRMAHLPGHLPLMATGWIPLAFLWLDRAAVEKSARAGASTGLFYGLTALASWYYGYAVALAGVVYLAARTWPWRLDRGALRPAVAFAVVAASLIVPFALPYVALARDGRLRHTLDVANYWSVGFSSFVVPTPLHPLWGQLVPEGFRHESVERMLYLGAVPTILAVVGVVRSRDRAPRAFAAVAVVFLVLALGTTLRFGGEAVYVPVPPRVSEAFYRSMAWVAERGSLYAGPYEQPPPGTVNVPMPALAPYLWLPLFSSMRSFGRMALLSMLAIAVLAAVGASRLGWVGRKRALAMPLLVGATFLETLVWYETTPVGPRAVDVWLAQADRRVLAEFPLSVALSGPGQYYTIHHGKPVVFGYGTHIQREFRAAMPALGRFPAPEALAVLRQSDVGWVVVTPRAYGPDWPSIAGRLDGTAELRLAADLDGVRVYELQRAPVR
jgi:hypothetical protein